MTLFGAPLIAWGDLGNVVLVGFAGGVGSCSPGGCS